LTPAFAEDESSGAGTVALKRNDAKIADAFLEHLALKMNPPKSVMAGR